MPAGRPTEYSEEVITKSQEYINSCEDEIRQVVVGESSTGTRYEEKIKVKLPTIEGLARYLKVHRDTIYAWKKSYPQFSDIIEELQQKQADRLLSNGLSGDYNPTIAKVLLTKHGYTDKQEIDQKTTIEDKRLDLSKLTEDELRTLAEIQRKSGTSEA